MGVVLQIAVVAALAASCELSPSDAQATAPLGKHVPWGVYRGGGCVGVAQLAQFVKWFGQRPERGLDFFAAESWTELQSSAVWCTGCWDDAGHPPMTFSIPIATAAGDGDQIAKGAAGEYDEIFRTIGKELVRRGYADAVIRLGWEFNGDWVLWPAQGRERTWIAYWRRIVRVMRDIPGSAFKFDWTVSNSETAQRAQDAYPGDDYVDIIGLDVYNQSWSWTVFTASQRWNELLHAQHGLLWHKQFAAAHKKPMSFPEWGTGTRPDGHGAGDDPYFIRKMAAWIASNNVAYHNYWDYPAPDFNGELSAGGQPKAAKAFLAMFRRQH